MISLLEAIEDEDLFKRWFRDRETWLTWFAFIAALFGLPLDGDALRVYQQCTNRKGARGNGVPYSECHLVIGRRGGKSFILGLIAVFVACFRDFRPYLQPGERATILIIAADRKQSRIIIRYIGALLHEIPLLAQRVERETAESYDLINQATIEIATASHRLTRGYACPLILADELAFWRSEDDAASSDEQILAAIRPSQVQFPNSMLLCASSPHARKGSLWEAYARYHGVEDSRVLTWQAPSKLMNPTIPQQVIDDAYAEDPANASAEFGANFRVDISSFISRENLLRCVDSGVTERPFEARWSYQAFCDPSGGSSDSFTLCVSHREDEKIVIDVAREWRAPFEPAEVIADAARLAASYRIKTIRGDRYGGDWIGSAWRAAGFTYMPSEKSKSELYIEALPSLMSGSVRLLDHATLVNQFCALERKATSSGRDIVDHPSRGGAAAGRDDLCNSAAGCIAFSAPVRRVPLMGSMPTHANVGYASAKIRRNGRQDRHPERSNQRPSASYQGMWVEKK